MRLAEPAWLLLIGLAALPLLHALGRPKAPWPTLGGFARVRSTWRTRVRHLPVALRVLAIVCLAVAIARPQAIAGSTRIAGQGVAIVVALDQSSSMKAEDFDSVRGRVSRLDAAKETLARFVSGRADDPIGLVVFANYPFLRSPTTLDHTFLLGTIESLKTASPSDDGTNIGDAMAWALGALKETTTRRKVLVLLTDGRNQPAVSHPLDPLATAKLARELGVTVHTIAIGQAGGVIQLPEESTKLPITSEVAGPDVALLEKIAETGGGRAFRATDAHMLDDVFNTIDRIEKSPVRGTIQTRYRELFGPWVAVALALFVTDRLLSGGKLARLP
ncbi:MAG: VWA domain-containing protein [Isosphaeraceae bacterium]|nr:VWA domain-containing protein [Isosphaeraceae bacterium]